MKKSALALAILGTLAGVAQAQSNVTIYGLVDVGLVSERGANSRLGLASGIQSGSRLGFKGTEDLGGGYGVGFNLENGFSADAGSAAQGGLIFGRRATVSATTPFGAFTAGRRNTPWFNAIDALDPMNTGLAGNAVNLLSSTGVRMNNAVIYTSPLDNSFVGEVAYGFGEVAGDNKASRQLGASLNYKYEGLTAIAAYHSIENPTATDTEKHNLIGATYNFGDIITAHLILTRNKGTGTVDSRDLLAGVSVPFAGNQNVMVSYIRKDDRSVANADAKQVALGYSYSLSKRTNFYASYAKISNDAGATFVTNNGFGDREFNFGIRHKF